jgi:hypothetical protein
MTWPVVVGSYMGSFRRAYQDFADRKAAKHPLWTAAQVPLALPETRTPLETLGNNY